MKNTSGVSLAAGGSTPNERFQIANIISFEQSRIFDAPSVFDAGCEGPGRATARPYSYRVGACLPVS